MSTNVEGDEEPIYRAISDRLQLHFAQGGSEADATDIASDLMQAYMEDEPARIVERLDASTEGMLRERTRSHRAFERRLRRHWGQALDQFYVVYVCAEEAGSEFDLRHGDEMVASRDYRFSALSGLHARACRTAAEVHRLLTGGFPRGALARARTVHEIAVTAMVINDYGTPDKHPNLAEAFLSHRDVRRWKDAQVYQEHCHALGYQPLSQETLSTLAARSQAQIDHFGERFADDYGWAAGVGGLGSCPNFRDLELLAGVSHLRGHYRFASHEVHSDSVGYHANIVEQGGQLHSMTGTTNAGLADPGQMALISLNQSLVAFLFSREDKSPGDVVVCAALARMVERACLLFVAGERSVQDAERQYLATLSEAVETPE